MNISVDKEAIDMMTDEQIAKYIKAKLDAAPSEPAMVDDIIVTHSPTPQPSGLAMADKVKARAIIDKMKGNNTVDDEEYEINSDGEKVIKSKPPKSWEVSATSK